MDKWLWATRLYKTRMLATEACKAGHVKVKGRAVKPSRIVIQGEIVSVSKGRLTRIVKAIEPLEKRVGASGLSKYVEDLTPKSEFERLHQTQAFHRNIRSRPTKRDRRKMDQFNEKQNEQ